MVKGQTLRARVLTWVIRRWLDNGGDAKEDEPERPPGKIPAGRRTGPETALIRGTFKLQTWI